ncbi:MAG: hypothetical protein M3409_00695 [Gemmatimonadota bacterium]|nr:hypothetical protein [Gemmatimonadota bacterium]
MSMVAELEAAGEVLSPAVRAAILALEAQIMGLQAQIAALQARVVELEARLGQQLGQLLASALVRSTECPGTPEAGAARRQARWARRGTRDTTAPWWRLSG